jgi:hypothetical protein
MAITVKLTDATIALGGDWNGALAMVKSIAGRSYDGQAKTWALPLDLKAFSARAAGRPFDVLASATAHRAGEHVTRWGTRYGRNEWDAKRAVDAIQVPAALVAEAQQKRDAAERALIAVLGPNAAKVRNLYDRFAGDLDEAAELGYITFSSPARKAAIEAAFETYFADLEAAEQAIDDFRAIEERKIAEDYGIY